LHGLQELEARACSSLLDVREMRSKDGSSLPLVSQLRRLPQLQAIFPLHPILGGMYRITYLINL